MTPPLLVVGRKWETDRLQSALSGVADHAEGAVVLLAGEAGVGKSHLLAAVSADAERRGFDVLSGRCFADADRPALGPWREALGEAHLHDGRFDAVLHGLQGRARGCPLLISIEDLHWADQDSLYLLLHLARFGLGSPMLLAASLRTGEPEAAAGGALDQVLAELARERRYQCFTIRRFTEDEVARYAEDLVGAPLPSAVVQAIHAETDGNPLYTRETVRHLLEEGKLALHDGRVTTDFSIAELGLPSTVRHLVRQQASRLSPVALALVRCACLVSGPVDLPTLCAAAGAEGESGLDPLDEAIAAGLLRPAGARYEVRHAIVRRAVLEELNPTRRLRLHRQVAEALAAQSSADPAAVAQQFHQSRALPGAERGAAHALAAAEQARAGGDHTRERALLTWAVELDPGHARASARLALSLAEGGDAAGAVAAAQEAARGLPAEASALLSAVAAELESAGAPRATWESLVRQGLSAQPSEATRLRLERLAHRPLAVLDGPVWLWRSPPAAGSDEARVPGDTPGETAALLERLDASSDPQAVIPGLEASTADLLEQGADFRAAAARAEALLGWCQRAGAPAARLRALALLGCARAATGDLDRARELRTQLRQATGRLGGTPRLQLTTGSTLDAVLGYLAGGTDWAALAAPLLELMASPAAADCRPGRLALDLALLAAALAGDSATALRLLPLHQRAVLALPLDRRGFQRDCGATAVWHLGHSEHAAFYLSLAADDLAAARPGCAGWTSAEHTAGRMAALLGQLPRARELFARARLTLARSGRPALQALVDLDEAQALLDGGLSPLPALDGAEDTFSSLGMEPWLQRTQQMRQRLPCAEPPAPDGLSTRELEVLRLLAAGRANKEIAAALFISVQTVERHVANIYAKTGAHGRASATGYALRRGLVPT